MAEQGGEEIIGSPTPWLRAVRDSMDRIFSSKPRQIGPEKTASPEVTVTSDRPGPGENRTALRRP
jgi:hypothetical protein